MCQRILVYVVCLYVEHLYLLYIFWLFGVKKKMNKCKRFTRGPTRRPITAMSGDIPRVSAWDGTGERRLLASGWGERQGSGAGRPLTLPFPQLWWVIAHEWTKIHSGWWWLGKGLHRGAVRASLRAARAWLTPTAGGQTRPQKAMDEWCVWDVSLSRVVSPGEIQGFSKELAFENKKTFPNGVWQETFSIIEIGACVRNIFSTRFSCHRCRRRLLFYPSITPIHNKLHPTAST